MTTGRAALLGATVALPLILGAGVAAAVQPADGRYVYVPPGTVVVFLPAPAAADLPRQILAEPVDFPVVRMMAQQEAMAKAQIARARSRHLEEVMKAASEAEDLVVRPASGFADTQPLA